MVTASIPNCLRSQPRRQDRAWAAVAPLAETERYAVADHVVARLKEGGDPRQLDDEAKPAKRTDHVSKTI